MLVEVLLALQAVSADGHAVVCRVDDVGVLQLAHLIELLQDAPDLGVDVLVAGELAADLIADGRLVAALHHPLDPDLISQAWVSVVEGMRRQVVLGERGRLGVRLFGDDIVVGAVLLQELLLGPARVVGVREAVVDEEGVLVLARRSLI